MKKRFDFILASGSPRRSDLLSQIGIPFKVIKSNADETIEPNESPDKMVQRLSKEKANVVFETNSENLTEPTLIISADTTVVAPDGKTILEKPIDDRDAFRMLSMIQGDWHQVYTGYTLTLVENQSIQSQHSRACRTRVRLRKLRDDQIKDYIQSGEVSDKAGSYAAQGIGAGLVESLEGSYSNVVGLPVAELIKDLEEHFGYIVRLSKN